MTEKTIDSQIKAPNIVARGILKILGWLGLTSGIGLMIVGGAYFIWGVFQFTITMVFGIGVEGMMTQIGAALYLIVGIQGLLAVGIAVMIRELKNK